MSKATVPGDYELEFTPGAVAAAMKKVGAKEGKMFMVPVDQITVLDGFNIRVTGTADYEAHIRSLMDSIKTEGFYPDQPLAGYADVDGDIIVTNGHCRMEAVNRLIQEGHPIEAVPVIVKAAGTSREDLTVALARSNTGKPLTPFEMGIVVKRLMSYGMDKPTIVTRLGITERYVDDLLLLQSAPATVRQMVVNDKVSATLAVTALRQDPKGAADALKAGLVEAEASGKKKVTGKHVKGKLKAAAKKKAGKKKKKGETEDPPAGGEPTVTLLPEAESRLSGNLDALEVIEKFQEKMPDFVDEIQRAIVSVAGQDELLDLAIKTERYVDTGLVRLGLVSVGDEAPADAPAAEAPAAGAAEEPAAGL